MPKLDEARLAAARQPRRVTLHVAPSSVYVGDQVVFTVSPAKDVSGITSWQVAFGPYDASSAVIPDPKDKLQATWDTTGALPGSYAVTATLELTDGSAPPHTISGDSEIAVKARPILSGDVVNVAMRRAAEEATSDAALWVVIRNSTNALGFENYVTAIDTVMCGRDLAPDCDSSCWKPPQLNQRRALPFPDMDGYRVLKIATECFLMMNCGVFIS